MPLVFCTVTDTQTKIKSVTEKLGRLYSKQSSAQELVGSVDQNMTELKQRGTNRQSFVLRVPKEQFLFCA